MNASAKVTSKGQITLPAELRKALHLKPGDRVEFRKTDSGNYELVAKTLRFKDLRGILKIDGPVPTAEEIVRIVAEAREGRAREIVERFEDRK